MNGKSLGYNFFSIVGDRIDKSPRRKYSKEASTASSEDDRDKNYTDSIREKLLAASLPYVSQYGWSQQALSEGAKSLNYPGVTSGIFANGASDLVFYFYQKCNTQLANQLQSIEKSNKSAKESPEIVGHAIEVRLRMIIPYLDSWPQALGMMTTPRNVPIALSHLLTMVDDICYHAGDRSVDFNWYSRRVAVAGIYKMTELSLIQDKSTDFSATWDFLHRRIEEAVQVQKFLQTGGEVSNVANEAFTAAFSTARNILRLNKTR